MTNGQSYIVRLLRGVERWLERNDHASEASRMGKIVQKIAQASDVHEALDALHRVEGYGEFALRLMWQLQVAEHGARRLENGAIDHHASVLGSLLVGQTREAENASPIPEFAEVDQVSVLTREVGCAIEELKRRSIGSGVFKGIEKSQLQKLLRELALLEQRADSAGRKDLSQFASACSSFIRYVVDHTLLHDVRVMNILDNANLTLQTAVETAGTEDHYSLESTIQLLSQPKELLD